MIRAFALALALAGCASNEHIIAYDMGGPYGTYSAEFHKLDVAGMPIRIVGTCGSSCTLALRNRNVCYTPEALFMFHAPSNKDGSKHDESARRFALAMPEGVQRWAEQTGAFNSTEVVSISGRDLAAFDGRLCNG